MLNFQNKTVILKSNIIFTQVFMRYGIYYFIIILHYTAHVETTI